MQMYIKRRLLLLEVADVFLDSLSSELQNNVNHNDFTRTLLITYFLSVY